MNRSGKARVVGDGKRGARRGSQAPGHVARRKGQRNRRKQRHAKADDPPWIVAKPVVPAVSHVLKGNKRQHYARQDEEHHDRRGAREEARTPRAKRLDHDVDVIQEHHQRPEPSQAVKRQDALLVSRHHHPFLRAFERSVPLYPRGFSVHFDEKDPQIGRIRGSGSSLCTLSGAATADSKGAGTRPTRPRPPPRGGRPRQ